MKNLFTHWRNDLPSSLVVFLVALPLCLGVGLASTNVEGIEGMPNIISGLIAGISGGIVVGILSGSRLGVSGPAAGLITIVSAAIVTLGSFNDFLVAVVMSGVLQVLAGYLRAGVIGSYFPSAVIKGMLAAIGITLILKEIPHALGYDKDFMGDDAFFQLDGHNTFSELLYALEAFHPGAIIVSVISLAILIILEKPYFKKFGLFKILPGALWVVVFGVLLNMFFGMIGQEFVIKGDHLVKLPVFKSLGEAAGFINTPNFSALTNPDVYVIAFTIALVGSLESLLSVEATDKLDPDKRFTPTNRELKAQGVGNIVSGLLGGLPVTQVIIRSSANINSGGKSKLSTIVHGFLLLTTVLLIPGVLNMIPLASLAAVLLMVGYKLARIGLFKEMYRHGLNQFIPFVATIAGVLLTDLLKGIGIGMAIAVFYILRRNYRNNFKTEKSKSEAGAVTKIVLSEEVTFLNKAGILEMIGRLKRKEKLIIDGSNCMDIDYDVLEVIHNFKNSGAKLKEIELELINIPEMR